MPTIASNLSFLQNSAGAVTTGTINSLGSPITLSISGSEANRIDGNLYSLLGYTTSQGAHKLQVNGNIFASGSLIVTTATITTIVGAVTTASSLASGTAGQIVYQSAPGVSGFTGPGTAGQVLVSNGTSGPVFQSNLVLNSNTVASSTATGALQVNGGVGVGGSLYAGNIFSNGVQLTAGSSMSITDDTTTASDYYPLYATATSGTLSGVRTSSTKFIFNPSTGQLTVIDINTTSDEKLKGNIQTISNPVNLIKQLRGVEFNWIENGKKSYGVIAQELEKILPELIGTDGRDFKSVAYLPLIGFLIEAVKQQQSQIDELYGKIG